jgi:hypothetical protein
MGAIAMFTVTDNTTLASVTTNGSPYSGDLADLQLPFVGITTEYANITPDNLSITTDSPSFITSGTGNDVIVDASAAPGDVVIDAGGGTNAIQCSSNPTSHDTIIVDAESDAPLVDVINGLQSGDHVLFKGLTAPPASTDTPQGLMLTATVPATGPAAQVFMSGYSVNDFATGRLSFASFTPPSSLPEASPYLLVTVAG